MALFHTQLSSLCDTKAFTHTYSDSNTDTYHSVVVFDHHGSVVKVWSGPAEQDEVDERICALTHRIHQRSLALLLHVLSQPTQTAHRCLFKQLELEIRNDI